MLDSFANSNGFSSLESDRLDDTSTSLMTDLSHICTPRSQSNPSCQSIGKTVPKATSTLKSNKPKSQSQKQTGQSEERLTILNINCRSVRNKVPELHQVIEQTEPDVIACTETWLKPEINSSEIFPDSLGYTVIRDDRLSGKGSRVLLVISKRLTCEEQPNFKSDYNITWAKITIKGLRSICVSSFLSLMKMMKEVFQNFGNQSKEYLKTV